VATENGGGAEGWEMAKAMQGDRLHLLYELSRGLTAIADLPELLRYVTRRTRALFDAEGCAILLLDQARGELYFPVVSDADPGLEGTLETVRFPAERGIAGWVLANDQPLLIPDVAQDPRFFGGVDQITKMTTRAMLCAPLRAESGTVGVIEVVNPAPRFLNPADLEFLETLAHDVARGCEKALLFGRLRQEASRLRQVCRAAGAVAIGFGVLVVVGTTFRHVGMALPLSELPTRPSTLVGALSVLIGGSLVAIGRGWLVTRVVER
jgi:signal transduction protein with GAF and PtsI domain